MAGPEVWESNGQDGVGSAHVSKLAGWLGAATSVVLVGGLVWWVADIALRDVRGVPVVRAMEGPARVAPEDPGGFEAAHQGYTVNRIASDDVDEPLAERVVLAPEPVAVTDEDRSPAEAVAAEAPKSRDDALKTSIGAALMEAIESDPDGAVSPGATPEASRDPASPRPRQRPEMGFVTRVSANPAAPAPLLTAAAGEIASTEIPSGTRLVQLGAFETEDVALAAWSQLSAEFGNYMNGKARVLEKAEMADRQVWRLRAHGFKSLSDARSFCAVLVAAQSDCIPVLTR